MIAIRVVGMRELKAALSNTKVKAALMRGATRSGIDGANQVKINWPVDTGAGRASTMSEARATMDGIDIVVGTNKAYAKPVEFGSGIHSDAPDSHHTPFFPPPGALAGWARRHGNLNPFAIARAIFLRGGTKPRRMFRSVLESEFFSTVVNRNVANELRRVFKK